MEGKYWYSRKLANLPFFPQYGILTRVQFPARPMCWHSLQTIPNYKSSLMGKFLRRTVAAAGSQKLTLTWNIYLVFKLCVQCMHIPTWKWNKTTGKKVSPFHLLAPTHTSCMLFLSKLLHKIRCYTYFETYFTVTTDVRIRL